MFFVPRRMGNPFQRQVLLNTSSCILGIVQKLWVCRFIDQYSVFLLSQIYLRIFIAFIDYPWRLSFWGVTDIINKSSQSHYTVTARRTYYTKMITPYSFTLPISQGWAAISKLSLCHLNLHHMS